MLIIITNNNSVRNKKTVRSKKSVKNAIKEEGFLVSPWSLVVTRLKGVITAIFEHSEHKLKQRQ